MALWSAFGGGTESKASNGTVLYSPSSRIQRFIDDKTLQYTVLPPTGLFQALGGPLFLPRHTRPCPFPFLFTKAVDRQSK